VLAGSADFKTDLLQSDMFDPRLQKQGIIIIIITIIIIIIVIIIIISN
jgi:hypothetical protein